jgi:tetratricopeptide (TPR) repeat protein
MDPAGAAVLHAHDPAAAAAFAARARRLHPAWPDADWWLGRHLAESGRHADAAAHLEAFLRSCPHHTGAVILLGTCWLALDQPARAQQLWRWAMGNCHFEPRQAALLLRRLGEHARARGLLDCAIENFAEAAALDPGDATLHNWLGIALLEARQFARAIEALERAAAMGFALAHTNLGICHFQAGDAARALQHFAAASKKLPDDPTAQQNYERAIASISPRPAGG